MKSAAKRRLTAAISILLPLALFFVIREQVSWRPRVLGQMKPGMTSVLSWSPDGQSLAVADESEYLESGRFRLWNVRDKSSRAVKFKHDNPIWARQFWQGGDKIVNIGWRSLFDVYAPRGALPTLKVVKPWRAFAFSPDGQKMVCQENFDAQTNLVLRDLKTGTVTGLASAGFRHYYELFFSPDGKRVGASILRDDNRYVFAVWDLKFPQKPIVIRGNEDNVVNIAFWPNNSFLALASINYVHVSNVETGRLVAKGQGTPYGTALSPDGVTIAQKVFPYIELRAYPSMRVLRKLHAPATNIASTLAFSPDGRTLAVGDTKGLVTLWRIK